MSSKPETLPRQPMPYLGRDPTEAEVAEWKRLESLRLATPLAGRALLGSLEKQERFVHAQRVLPLPCWLCGLPINQYSAARMVDIPFPLPEMRCIRCGVRMVDAVPFVAMGPPWYWKRPTDMDLPEIVRTLESNRAVWGADTRVELHEQETIKLDGLEYLGFEGPMVLTIGKKVADDAELSAMLSFDGGWSSHKHAAELIAEGLRIMADAVDERPWPSDEGAPDQA